MTKRDNTSEYKRENRRKNLVFGVVLFVVLLVLHALMGLAGIPIQWGPV